MMRRSEMTDAMKTDAPEAATGPTDLPGLLAQQFGMVYAVVAANTDGMSQEDSLAQPQPSGNCANWIVAHLLVVHNSLMQLLGEAPVLEDARLTLETLFEPIVRPDQAFDWDTMRDRFVDSEDRCVAAVARLSSDELARPMTGPFGEPTTLAGLLGTVAGHQIYHAGQLGVARRIAGLEGAVRGPGQDA
jgi:uncharacterized damage-inducible protein DinB